MSKQDIPQTALTQLRLKAEALLKSKPSLSRMQLLDADDLKLLQELEVYQLELEMQNEELMLSRSEVKQAAEKYTELYDSVPTGYFTLSTKGDITELNLSGAAMLGKPRHQLKNSRLGFFITAETLPVYNQFLDNIFYNQTKQICEVTLLAEGHQPMPVLLTGIPDKNLEQCLVSVADITERKQAEKALLDSEQKYRLMLESSEIGMGVFSLDGKILYYNQRALHNLGGKADDYIGKTLHEIFGEAVASVFEAHIQESAQSEKSIEYEEFVELAPGNRWFLSIYSRLTNPDGKVFGVQLIAHDITDRKLAEEALKKSIVQLELAHRAAGAGTWDWDMINQKLNWSEELYSLFGLDPARDEATFESWTNVVHPDDRAEASFRIEKAVLEKTPLNSEYRVLHGDGKIHWISSLGNTIYNKAGEPLRMTGICTDITGRKQVEEVIETQHALLTSLLNSSTDIIIFSLDKNYCYTAFNEKHRKEMKIVWEADIEVGTNILDCMHDVELRNLAKKSIDRALNGETFTEIQHQPGPDIYYELNWNPIRMHSDVVGITVFLRDITERKKSDEALQKSEERYRSLLTNLDAGIVIHGPDTSIIMNNHRASELLGLSEDQMKGRLAINPDWKFLRENSIDPLPIEEYPVNRIIANRKPFRDIIFGVVRPLSSDIVWLTVNGFPVFDQHGELTEILISFIDITERKRVEESLRLKNLVFDASIAANSISRPDGIITEANAAFLKIWGYSSKDEVVGKPIAHFLDDPSEAVAIITSLNGTDEWEGDYTARRKDGTTFIAHGLGTTIKDASGKIIGYQSAVIDFTERRKAEKALRESEQKFRDTVAYLDEGFYSVTFDGILLEHNKAFSRLLGFDQTDDMRGTRLPDFWQHPEERKVYLQEFLDKGSISNYQINAKTKTGKEITVLLSSHLIRDKENNPARIEGVFLDITERIRSEESLRRHSERLQNLHKIDQAILAPLETPEAIIQNALQHIRSLLSSQHASIGIVDFENAALQVFTAGINSESIELESRSLVEEAYEELEMLRQKRLEVVDDVSSKTITPELMNILRSEGIMSCINVPLVAGEKLIGAMNLGWENPRAFTVEELEIANEVATEVTIAIEQIRLRKETKRYAEEMEKRVIERTVQLEASNKELEAFSYSVSHDLRAPLRHISGYVELLTKNLEINLSEKEKHYLDTIADSAHQMGVLIDDLLQFSRTGRQEMQKTELDMNEVVREVLELIKPETNVRDIKWTLAELPHVYGDFAMLRLVWLNLISNAIKFTMFKKKASIEIGVTDEATEYIFYVRDNGVGFDMQYAHKLFGVFQRLHTSQEFEGTGIGLATVRRIVLRHGGRTWAKGESDKGAVFYFSIPKNKE